MNSIDYTTRTIDGVKYEPAEFLVSLRWPLFSKDAITLDENGLKSELADEPSVTIFNRRLTNAELAKLTE